MSLITNKDQLKIIQDFTHDLENSLGVKHQKLSFNDLWDADPPAEAEGETLQQWMKDVSLDVNFKSTPTDTKYACRDSFFHDDYHNFDQFRKDYEEKFSATPYVSPPVRWQW